MMWLILAVSTLFIAAFSLAVTEVVGARTDFQQHRQLIALGLDGLGLALLALGKMRAARRLENASESPSSGASTAGTQSTFFLGNSLYWGSMLMLFGAIVFSASPSNLRSVEFLKLSNLKMSALPSAGAPDDKPAESEQKVAAVAFPLMQMQGVNANGRNPCVVINTKTYFIGERVGEAVVTAIDRTSATLELAGETKVLTLQK